MMLFKLGLRNWAQNFEGKAISVSLLKLYCEDIRSF